MINDRKMGEEFGYWNGIEVEQTQFVGLETLFISRHRVADEVLARHGRYPHVFFAVINPLYEEGYCIGTENPRAAALSAVYFKAQKLLEAGKYVTIEVGYQESNLIAWHSLRKDHPKRFCLLIVVTVPDLGVGGFAIKAAPFVLFQPHADEAGVMVASFDTMKEGETTWEEYVDDEDGVALS